MLLKHDESICISSVQRNSPSLLELFIYTAFLLYLYVYNQSLGNMISEYSQRLQ